MAGSRAGMGERGGKGADGKKLLGKRANRPRPRARGHFLVITNALPGLPRVGAAAAARLAKRTLLRQKQAKIR